MTEQPTHDGYDDFLDAVAAGEPYYLEDTHGEGWLPPRTVGPETGDQLERQPLPTSGTIKTKTTTHVAGPDFVDDTPYVVAIASFGPVDIPGQVRDCAPEEVESGMSVSMAVEQTNTTGNRIVVFTPE